MVTWDAVADATGYRIDVSDGRVHLGIPGDGHRDIPRTTSTTLQRTQGTDLTRYYRRVRPGTRPCSPVNDHLRERMPFQ